MFFLCTFMEYVLQNSVRENTDEDKAHVFI